MTIQKRRAEQTRQAIAESVKAATSKKSDRSIYGETVSVDEAKVLSEFYSKMELDIDKHSCKDALDSLQSAYKVLLKTFIDNIMVQVVEHHMLSELDSIFSPLMVESLNEEEIRSVAAEPSTITRQRDNLESRQKSLEAGHSIFKAVLRRSNLV
ncbi:MAG: hypothetical protein M1814_002435 [Vezdaea aestivalis]|nr:MAG: hypothetical protein M1814_002435 [Vezdaea aestivalis]